MRMGIPKVITTDQGKEFNNSLNKELTNKLQIQQRLTTAYHPQVIINIKVEIYSYIQVMNINSCYNKMIAGEWFTRTL